MITTLLQLFMKAPVAGQVKTRLCPPLSALQAVDIHQRLCWQLSEQLSGIEGITTEVWAGGDMSHPFFNRLCGHFDMALYPQTAGNLGARMFGALQHGLLRAERVVIVGGDCLSVDAAYVQTAIARLEYSDSAVLGPAEDGGYVLVGVRECRPGMFEAVEWGSDRALVQTHANFEQLNYRVNTLCSRWDIDTYADLQRYAPALIADQCP